MSLSNQQFLQNYQLSISTLSPVHLGCGEDYEPTSYVMHNSCLYPFAITRLVDALSPQDLQELDGINKLPNPLISLQKFIHSRKNQLFSLATTPRPVAPSLYKKYEQAVGRAVNQEASGKQIRNNLEIARTAYTGANEQPYLPGSSLKGALRTAVLNSLNAGKATNFKEREANKLEAELLKGSFQNDPLRLVKVADANFQPTANTLEPRLVFANNIKRKKPETNTKASGLSLMYEAIPAFNTAAFTGQLSIQSLDSLKATASKDLPQLTIQLADLVTSCNNFYLPQLKKLQQRLSARGCLNEQWNKNLEQILQLLEPFVTAKAGFVLRVGRYSSAESLTLDGVRSITLRQGPKPPIHGAITATTDWLAGEEEKAETNLLPFGWVFVDLNLPELPELKAARQKLQDFLHLAAQPALAEQTQLFAEVKEQQIAAQAALVAAQEKAAEETAKQEAKQIAEKQAAEKFATLSAEEQSLVLIEQRIATGEGANQGASCELATDLAALVESATSWQSEVKAQLHTLAIQACKHLNINHKKNAKWKQRLRALQEAN